MFTWTAELVLRLIDAMERTTIETYNSCYVFGIRKGLGLANAHAYAMNQTLIWLADVETQRLADHAIDAVVREMTVEAHEAYVEEGARLFGDHTAGEYLLALATAIAA